MFPKPKDVRREPEAVRVYPGGREVCNMLCVEGKREYRRRVLAMLSRQHGMCCLYGHCPDCPGVLLPAEATMEHEFGRGSGGSKRDDRIELPDGTWINGASHGACNTWKGSRYIPYNAAISVQEASAHGS